MLCGLLLLLGVVVAIHQRRSDPCASIFAYEPVQVRHALACMNSIPFSDERRVNATRLVSKLLPMYSFLDLAISASGWLAPTRVDLAKGVQLAQSKDFASDWAFHQTLVDLFRQPRDAHLSYYAPFCYGRFVFINPLVPFAADGKVFVMNPRKAATMLGDRNLQFEAVLDYVDTLYGPEWVDWISGAQLLSVDDGVNGDRDVWTFLKAFQDEFVGSSKSSEVRLERTLTRVFATHLQLGAFTQRNTHRQYYGAVCVRA